jgi:hypothetical protein
MDTTSHLAKSDLKNFLEAGMNEGLQQIYITENVQSITPFQAWLSKVKELNEQCSQLKKEIACQVLYN